MALCLLLGQLRQNLSTQTPAPQSSSQTLVQSSKRAIIGGSATGITGLALIILGLFFCTRRRRYRPSSSECFKYEVPTHFHGNDTTTATSTTLYNTRSASSLQPTTMSGQSGGFSNRLRPNRPLGLSLHPFPVAAHAVGYGDNPALASESGPVSRSRPVEEPTFSITVH
ncbi:hypothetical protein AX16_007336 [Volvariella volvacea WC 439]|nr:hypothetical protein AX16_007336 [Volvariella volvacea WC 439]